MAKKSKINLESLSNKELLEYNELNNIIMLMCERQVKSLDEVKKVDMSEYNQCMKARNIIYTEMKKRVEDLIKSNENH